MSVKKKILSHEYDEMVQDQYSQFGHLELVVRQGKNLGMSSDEVLKVKPLPTTRATLYSWGWITRERPWLEGLAALMATEWGNDDRLCANLGGGVSRREALRWMEDLGMKWKEIPNLAAHAEADEEHRLRASWFVRRNALGLRARSENHCTDHRCDHRTE
jgi:pyrroloquinoline quinone (PQQ) biosynthesis protein C